MDTLTIALSVAIALLIGGFAAYLMWAQRKFVVLEEENKNRGEGLRLTLAAYERITLFTERVKLASLVNRLYDSSLTARQMQQVFLQTIRDEFEHNLTQQLYIKPEIWEGIVKMKDQNSYIINQLAAMEPANAIALDLNKKILEFNHNSPDSTLNNVILDAMQFEVKRLIALNP